MHVSTSFLILYKCKIKDLILYTVIVRGFLTYNSIVFLQFHVQIFILKHGTLTVNWAQKPFFEIPPIRIVKNNKKGIRNNSFLKIWPLYILKTPKFSKQMYKIKTWDTVSAFDPKSLFWNFPNYNLKNYSKTKAKLATLEHSKLTHWALKTSNLASMPSKHT